MHPPPDSPGTAGDRSPPPAALPAVALGRWLRGFLPQPVRVDAREQLRACVGAALGILVAALASRALAPGPAGVWLIAPMGASAVLLFVVPASPLAQPWPVLAGNAVSALVGIGCARAIADPALAAPVAVGLAIGAMLALRCLHPPGGGTALLAVLAHETAWHFAAFPVLADAALLVAAGIAFNNLTGRRYPHVPPAAVPGGGPAASRFTAADLDAALARYDQVLDVSREDLEALLREAEAAAYRRTLGTLRCRDAMSRDVATVEHGTPLHEAWALLRRRRVKALPVVDRAGRLAGIVTQADFLRHGGIDARVGLVPRLRALVRRADRTRTDSPGAAVGQIMTRRVRVASAERPLVELVPLFSEQGHHHVPIIDAERRLVGILTQSDMVRALYGVVQARNGAAP